MFLNNIHLFESVMIYAIILTEKTSRLIEKTGKVSANPFKATASLLRASERYSGPN